MNKVITSITIILLVVGIGSVMIFVMTDFQSSLELKQKELEQKQRLQSEAQLKTEIIEMTKTNPRIKGIINGELRFYIEPLPSYAASEVKESMRMIVNVFEHSTAIIPNVEMHRVYDENSADIPIKSGLMSFTIFNIILSDKPYVVNTLLFSTGSILL